MDVFFVYKIPTYKGEHSSKCTELSLKVKQKERIAVLSVAGRTVLTQLQLY